MKSIALFLFVFVPIFLWLTGFQATITREAVPDGDEYTVIRLSFGKSTVIELVFG